MPGLSRRQFLKQGLALAALAGVAPDLLQREIAAAAPAELQIGPGPHGWVDTLPELTPAPQLANATAFSLQTPHFALDLDLAAADHQTRFNQLSAQGYREIWIQGGPNSDGAAAATISDVWVRDGLGPWFEYAGMDAATYQSRFSSLAAQGYRPISVSGYADTGGTRFAAIWLHDTSLAYVGGHNMTGAQYQTFFNANTANGFAPALVDGYDVGGTAYYIAIMVKPGPAAFVAGHGMSGAQVLTMYNTYAPQGYYVACLSGYEVAGATLFAMIMHQPAPGAWQELFGISGQSYHDDTVNWNNQDYRPLAAEGYEVGAGVRNFAGIWINHPRSWTATGKALPGLANWDTMMQNFMQPRHIRSGALAVTRDSRLVLARGYSYDNNPLDPVSETSLFRIASLTKPITSMAIMRLVQEGRLRLSAKLVNLLGITSPADPRMNDITVLELLQHLGGWDRAISPDPMFYDIQIAGALGVGLPITQANIIAYMNGQMLNHTPGTAYAYSNYGYLLLGRIIEHVTGLPYPTYVQQAVLNPLHITRIVQGRSPFNLRKPDEVAYHTLSIDLWQDVLKAGAPVDAMQAYGSFNLENMDSHGAWLATVVDLARFSTALDPTGHYPVLYPENVAATFAQPAIPITPGSAWYACGWIVRTAGTGLNTWHDGSLPGTLTYMVRRWDGINYVAFFDQRDDASGLEYEATLDAALYAAADAVATWPAGDLFPAYGLPAPVGAHKTYLPSLAR